MPADLADADGRAGVVPTVTAALGPVDVLVNNAAAAFYRPTSEIPLKRRRLTFELNVEAPIDLAQAVLPVHPRAPRRLDREHLERHVEATGGAALRLGLQARPHDDHLRRVEGRARAHDDRPGHGVVHRWCGGQQPGAGRRAVRTPGADTLVGDVLDENPSIVEPLELFVEAALVLATADPATMTGRICYSGPLFEELGRDYRGLDGRPRASP